MRSKKLKVFVSLAALLFVAGAVQIASASASDFYLRITGEKQGVFQAEGSSAMGGAIVGSQFSYTISAPKEVATGKATGREASSGQATGQAVVAPKDHSAGALTGKRQHGSIIFVKEWGAASPQLAKAMSTGEILTSVDIQFVHPGAKGAPEVYKTIHMTNVMVSSIRTITGNGGAGSTQEITLTADAQDIVPMTKDGKKSAMDDWMGAK